MNHQFIVRSAVASMILLSGCVGTDTHTRALKQLEAARKAQADTAASFDGYQKKATTDLQALQQDNARLSDELSGARTDSTKTHAALEAANRNLDSAALARAELERQSEALRQERDGLQSKADDLQRRVESAQQEVASGKRSLEQAQSRFAQDGADREKLAAQVAELKGQITKSQERLAGLTTELNGTRQGTDRVTQERDQLRQEQEKLQATLVHEQERLKAEEAERARLEQERAAKEEEIRRLTRTQEDLAKSLEDEIAKGDIKIQQVRDRLTINMVDRVLFDSGHAKVKPAGVKVLKQMSGILKKVTDKQIRIEGHTDNVPVGQKIRERFPTNWELSTARATSVVRYLIDDGGLNPATLSAIGHADNRPVASNETEEGKTSNRRIEIILFPKDISQVTNQIAP
ncbi:MAG: OmpA family protein [Nitrospiraceae bacterium]